MIGVITGIANAVIGEADLPDFHRRPQVLFRAKGKTAFDELNRALQRDGRSDQKVEVLRHQDIFMQFIGATTIRVEYFQKKVSPSGVPKESAALPSLGGDKVCFTGASNFSDRSQFEFPQGLKPRIKSS